MTRLSKWERLARKGNFSKMPKPFRWSNSGVFAHFINPNEVEGGFDGIADLANRLWDDARDTGEWRGDARELWLTLFFQHRAQRHMASDYSGTPLHEDLCEALREVLWQLDRRSADALMYSLGLTKN